MRWQDQRRSNNVEDRRGSRISGPVKGGGIGLLLLALVGMYFGIDPSTIMNMGGAVQQQTGAGKQQTGPVQENAVERERRDFVSVVLADTEDNWNAIFRRSNKQYQEPKLVLFRDAINSACGFAQSAMGPFYCPADEKVYLDLSFYRDMQNHLGGGGDFALGYVLAHEVGHHVQKQLGITDRVSGLERGASKKEANRLSVMLELQADCFAGVWGRYTADQGMLENGDLQEALDTAAAIGDDRLQRQSQGRVVPDSFTHGTSKQRYTWFRRGFDSGNPQQCNTFAEMR